MIKIDAAEASELENQFAGVSDRTIIRELVRRKRLRQAQASTFFYPEMREDDHYMANIRESVIRSMARAVADMDDCRPALLSESVAPPMIATEDGKQRCRQHGESVLTADIVFLVARNKAEG